MSATRHSASRDEVGAFFAAAGEPAYRGAQAWDTLYSRRRPVEEATALPRASRAAFAEAFPLALTERAVQTSHDRATVKWLWGAAGDAELETVLMLSPKRATVCVSSQAGCAMACTFCATGQAGFTRHLDAGEIVEQVLRAQHHTGARVSNVVYMGMGEPLANYDAVWASVERLHADLGLSARHLTVSTVGVVPGMRRLAHESLPVTLAVSLHAAADALRDRLVPLNRRYPIAEVLDAAAECAAAHRRRVTFEYACIAGVNDAPAQLSALGRLLADWPGAGGAHVNLIPLNPTAGFPGRAPRRQHLVDLATILGRHGVTATVRRNRGVDIDAACGQLRARHTPARLPVRAPAEPSPATPAATMVP